MEKIFAFWACLPSSVSSLPCQFLEFTFSICCVISIAKVWGGFVGFLLFGWVVVFCLVFSQLDKKYTDRHFYKEVMETHLHKMYRACFH